MLAGAFLVFVLFAPGHAAEGESVINVCNVGNTMLFVVMIGPTPRGTMAIDGWREVQVGNCQSAAVSSHSIIGFAVKQANGRKAMQIYDPASFANPALLPTEWKYCVDPNRNFHREAVVLKSGLTRCDAGEVPARFAFHVKPKMGETVTLRVPADKDGDIIPLLDPASLRPFEPNVWIPEPNARFVLAMKGLAEQQEALDFRIARRDPSPSVSWAARYIRDLGIVVRPETYAVSVTRNSPAYRAGIRQGDEIIEIDSIRINSAWHARSLLVRTRPGQTHALTFLHAGESHTRQITLGTLPANLAMTELHPKRGWLGTEFESAARVVGVIYRDGTPHLELDDDIQRIGREDFDGVDGLAEWLNQDRGNLTAELQVWRPSIRKIIVLKLSKLM